MDQEKTGKFISKLRKEKGLTQSDLAEKMNVSTNAVSKWERGLSFPDVSLYKNLCKELDISIEELINGERDNSEKSKEEAIIKTLNEKDKIKKKSRKVLIILSTIFLSIIVLLVICYIYLRVNLISNSEYLYEEVINALKEDELNNNPDSKNKDFNVFYSYHPFGIEKKGIYKYAYMWIYSQSYYLEEDDVLAISSGFSIPYKVTFKNDKIIRIETPKDGNLYTSSIKRMFPGIIKIQVLNFDKEKNINKLFNEVSAKKNIYYDYLNLDMSKIKLEDISYNDLLFSVRNGKKNCITVELSVLKNNKYILYTHYKACPKGKVCNSMLVYTKNKSGSYNYDVIEIIKHSIDASNLQFTNDNLPDYEMFSGNGYQFITDKDNRFLKDFLKSINVDLDKCAEPDYVK